MIKQKKRKNSSHEPVMADEVVNYFFSDALLQKTLEEGTKPKIIDATLGLGGHTIKLLQKGCEILGIDADSETLKLAHKNILKACPATNDFRSPFKLVHGNFRNIEKIAEEVSFDDVEGILFDLGVNTPQLTSENRGFSFQHPEAQLDMRLDQNSQGVKASDLLGVLNEKELIKLFGQVIRYDKARKLAKGIVQFRKNKPIKSVNDFLEIINKSGLHSKRTLNVATLPFMALRMAVNTELDNLELGLKGSINLLKKGGRLVVISFHSGEDGIVKETFNIFGKEGLGVEITPEPILPSSKEISENVKARSAKMRVFEKNKK